MPVSKKTAARALVDGRELERFWGTAAASVLVERALARADGQTLGDGPRWLEAIATLEALGPATFQLGQSAPSLSRDPARGASLLHASPDGCAGAEEVRQAVLGLSPWRKGPFQVFGVNVDSEWRCELKWERLTRAIDFSQRRLLDVGCGNGYYLMRALGAGARAALGVDPTWLYVAQFAALRRACLPRDGSEPPNNLPAWVLPVGLEELESAPIRADIVLSMGVLYHRKSPLEHLERLRALMVRDTVLVLETLVVPGDAQTVLMPKDRYAAMRNVWMIPSVEALYLWLQRTKFKNVQLVDVSVTTEQEQRVTAFAPSRSLSDFLDPVAPDLTREGYPRPRRALLIAHAA